jgi:hypothetical protein
VRFCTVFSICFHIFRPINLGINKFWVVVIFDYLDYVAMIVPICLLSSISRAAHSYKWMELCVMVVLLAIHERCAFISISNDTFCVRRDLSHSKRTRALDPRVIATQSAPCSPQAHALAVDLEARRIYASFLK